MENTPDPSKVKMPRSIDMSQMTEEELCSDLLEALDEIERGNVISSEDLKADFSRRYGITFDV